MTPVLAVMVVLAGGVAAVLRYSLSMFFASRRRSSTRTAFPWAVLVVNALGSALAGCAAGLSTTLAVSPEVRLVLITGVAGGLTTFSTFSVETVGLVRSGRWAQALASCILNLALGLGLAIVGYAVGVLLSS